MAEDLPAFKDRPYVCIDQTMPEKPSVAALSDAAFRLFIEAICYCGRNETNGYIPKTILRRMTTKAATVNELTRRHIEAADNDTWHLVDYLQWNRSHDEITALRESRRDRGAKGNHKRWHVARRLRDKDCPYCYPVRGVEGGTG